MTDAGSGLDWEELARNASQPGASAETEELRQLLALSVDGTPYAVPVEAVREIVRMRPLTPIPRVVADVRGVISLRGEIIQVVDLRRRLGLQSAEPTRRSRIIVLGVADELIAGLLVDRVSEVMRAPVSAFRSPLGGDNSAVEALIEREGVFVSLLDLERVLGVGDV